MNKRPDQELSQKVSKLPLDDKMGSTALVIKEIFLKIKKKKWNITLHPPEWLELKKKKKADVHDNQNNSYTFC